MKQDTPIRWTIGIDPDTDKSGVALYRSDTQALELHTLALFDLLEFVGRTATEATALGARLSIYVEAGYLIGTVWHASRRDSPAAAAAKGRSVGRNHEAARYIIRGIEHLGLTAHEVKPLRKMGGRKASHRLFCAITGYKGSRTNQETRDAGLIAYHYAAPPHKKT